MVITPPVFAEAELFSFLLVLLCSFWTVFDRVGGRVIHLCTLAVKDLWYKPLINTFQLNNNMEQWCWFCSTGYVLAAFRVGSLQLAGSFYPCLKGVITVAHIAFFLFSPFCDHVFNSPIAGGVFVSPFQCTVNVASILSQVCNDRIQVLPFVPFHY